MQLKARLAAVSLAFATLSLPAHALSLQDVYSSFYVFGDSLSDPGNTPIGSITDGEVWAQPLTDGFAPGSSENFATIGAEVIDDLDAAPFDIDDQIQAFKADVGANILNLGSRPLAAIWAGANDVFSILEGFDPGNVLFNEQRAINAALGVVSVLQDLSTSLGIKDFVVFDLPDLGATPFAKSLGQEALLTGLTNSFNATLDAGLGGLKSTNPQINDIRIPIFDLIHAAILDPPAYGVVSMELPCNIAPLTSGLVDCTFEQASALGLTAPMLGFYDAVHPSSTLHAQIGEIVVDAATVPLPAGMPLLLGALGFVMMRRRA